MKVGTIGGWGSASLIALALVLTPALAASRDKEGKERSVPSITSGVLTSFTPATADPRLAAAYARRGFQSGSFRFTPSSASPDKGKSVRVAVRARSGAIPPPVRSGGASSAAVTAITPTSYNLGAAVGWKRFALSGDVARVENGTLPGEREAAEVGVSYAGNKFTTKVEIAAERADGPQRLIVPDEGYSLGVAGSYSITRNLAVTGGVRYKIERDRLAPLVDDRRDSQAVYIGTAFRF